MVIGQLRDHKLHYTMWWIILVFEIVSNIGTCFPIFFSSTNVLGFFSVCNAAHSMQQQANTCWLRVFEFHVKQFVHSHTRVHTSLNTFAQGAYY